MHIRDALFNWLQMKIVFEARPKDQAAQETLDFFALILKEDHGLEDIQVELENEVSYLLHYVQENEMKLLRIDREAVEQLLADIDANPKYNQDFSENT